MLGQPSQEWTPHTLLQVDIDRCRCRPGSGGTSGAPPWSEQGSIASKATFRGRIYEHWRVKVLEPNMTQSYEMDHISVSSTWTTDQVSVDILPNACMKTIWTVKGRGSKKRWGLGGNDCQRVYSYSFTRGRASRVAKVVEVHLTSKVHCLRLKGCQCWCTVNRQFKNNKFEWHLRDIWKLNDTVQDQPIWVTIEKHLEAERQFNYCDSRSTNLNDNGFFLKLGIVLKIT